MQSLTKITPLLVLGALLSTAAYALETKSVINPDHLPDTTQYGFSQATIVSAGAQIVYVAGQIGISDSGPNDFRSQVDRSFENLAAVLAASGSSADDVVKITLLVKGMDEEKLAYLVEKRRSFFGAKPPASTLIPVPELALPSLNFEIDAIAVVAD
jgi:enamine deaminase RidA (YjgF/YER057c/UK114 family)